MKNAIRSFSLVALVATFAAFLSANAGGGSATSTNFAGFVGFGNVSNACELYAVPNSKGMSASVYQETPEGEYVDVKRGFNGNINFTTKVELDAFFRQQVCLIAQGALTNVLVDKDGVFKIFVVTHRSNPNLGILRFLYHYSEFHLTRNPDGSYSLPDFSNLEMGLALSMVFEVPGLQWGRVEVSYASSGAVFQEEDSRYHSPEIINPWGGYLEIPTDLAVEGTNGFVRLKISLVTVVNGKTNFWVYGPMGNQIPETPVLLKDFRRTNEGRVSFTLLGGDPGRAFRAQKGLTPRGPWTDTVGETIVVRRYGASSYWEGPETGPTNSFYRVRSVDYVP